MSTESFLADYRRLSADVGLVDLSTVRSRGELRGDDRQAFLHNFCTNDIRGLAENAGCEAFLLNAKGHVLFYLFVWRRPDGLVVSAGAGRAAAWIAHLDRYVIREKVTLHDRTTEWGELLIAGPRAEAILRDALQCDAPDVAQASAGVPQAGGVFAVRTGWTRESNVTLVGPRSAIDECREKLAAAGVNECGFAALDALRIEAGLPLDGIDMSEKNLAQELDRNDRTLHFRKGCYLGQETVARLDALGHVNKTLVRLKFAGVDVVPPAGTELTSAGHAVGQVTSAALSPNLGGAAALADVKQGANSPGTVLQSNVGDAEVL